MTVTNIFEKQDERPTIVTLEDFAAVDEPGADPLLGDADGALIPEGGDVMAFGDGGAGKTTLLVDLACHLAAGKDWLGISIAQPVRVLIIENEGPRPLLRKKMQRKLRGWQGPPLDGRISVFEEPWGTFTFASETCRQQLADDVRDHEIDVLLAGPLTRLGMDAAGTLQETAAFMQLIADVRRQSGRRLTSILAHHENRAGTVSGAWEGVGDTLLHVQAAGNGHTIVFIQKARWSSAHHHKTLKLRWTDGEGFELEGDRDYLAEVRTILAPGVWMIAKEIAAPTDEGGIGASEKTVRGVLDDHPNVFESRTGDAAKALGRSPRSTLWGQSSGLNSVDSVGGFHGGSEGGTGSTELQSPPLKDSVTSDDSVRPPPHVPETELDPQLCSDPDDEAEYERLRAVAAADPEFGWGPA
jgi:AAA domain